MRFKILLLAALICGSAQAEEPSEEFKEMFRQATVHYDLGRFDRAAIEYEQLYEIRPDANLLFNIAQAYRQAGKTRKALHFYRAYKRKISDFSTHPTVNNHITDLEATLRVSGDLNAKLVALDEEERPAPLVVDGKLQPGLLYKYIDLAKVDPSYNLDLGQAYYVTTYGQAFHCATNDYPYMAQRCKDHASEPYIPGAVATHYRRYLKHFPSSPRRTELEIIIRQVDSFLETRLKEGCLALRASRELKCDRAHNYGYEHEADEEQ